MFDPQMFDFEIRELVRGMDHAQLNGFELRASSVGECERLLDYRAQGYDEPAVDYSQAVRMLMGHKLHEMWQEVMALKFGQGFHSMEQELVIDLGDGHQLTGHPDGVLSEYDAVYELKTVSKNTFEMIRSNDEPLRSHVEQGTIYACALGVSHVLIHYFSRDTGESLYYLVPVDRQEYEALLEKMRQRLANKETNTIADRPYNDPTAAPCWYCSMNERCYQGYEAEVTGMGQATFNDESRPGRLAIEAHQLRLERLAIEKVEKDSKKTLIEELLSQNVSACRVQGDDFRLDVSIKLGSKHNPLISIKETK